MRSTGSLTLQTPEVVLGLGSGAERLVLRGRAPHDVPLPIARANTLDEPGTGRPLLDHVAVEWLQGIQPGADLPDRVGAGIQTAGIPAAEVVTAGSVLLGTLDPVQ